jgi:2-polyprenyl-6-methoxyphenol hydroxylase-like FAD-dependent oxidoreductase
MALHVLIIGGGIAGLCLAHGLQKAGLSVAVYEKGPRLADPHWLQGHQIRLDGNGVAALKQCLPASLFEKVNANACILPSGFQILSEQMDQIGFVEPEVIDFPTHVPIVRTTVRDILLQGLDGYRPVRQGIHALRA